MYVFEEVSRPLATCPIHLYLPVFIYSQWYVICLVTLFFSVFLPFNFFNLVCETIGTAALLAYCASLG
jgi:hypothetical protein